MAIAGRSMTTIQLKEPTKEALFQTKNRLEAIFGRPLTYDEVIDHLIKTNRLRTGDPRSFQEFRGVLGNAGRKIYQELRQEESRHETGQG